MNWNLKTPTPRMKEFRELNGGDCFRFPNDLVVYLKGSEREYASLLQGLHFHCEDRGMKVIPLRVVSIPQFEDA